MNITLEKITKQNKDELAHNALSVYFGEKCLFCGRVYKTLDDLKDTIWIGQDKDRSLACLDCWKKNVQKT